MAPASSNYKVSDNRQGSASIFGIERCRLCAAALHPEASAWCMLWVFHQSDEIILLMNLLFDLTASFFEMVQNTDGNGSS